MVPVKTCTHCKLPRSEERFARRRYTGNGTWRGTNARRGICKDCEKKRWPPKPWKPRFPYDRRKVWCKAPTKSGIRESLIARGLVPGTQAYRNAYSVAYARMNPDVRALSQQKTALNRKAKLATAQL